MVERSQLQPVFRARAGLSEVSPLQYVRIIARATRTSEYLSSVNSPECLDRFEIDPRCRGATRRFAKNQGKPDPTWIVLSLV